MNHHCDHEWIFSDILKVEQLCKTSSMALSFILMKNHFYCRKSISKILATLSRFCRRKKTRRSRFQRFDQIGNTRVLPEVQCTDRYFVPPLPKCISIIIIYINGFRVCRIATASGAGNSLVTQFCAPHVRHDFQTRDLGQLQLCTLSSALGWQFRMSH
jgi:hypothetical protein